MLECVSLSLQQYHKSDRSSQLTSSIKENPRLRAAAEELKKTGVKVGDAVSEALKSMEESDVMRAVCLVIAWLPFSEISHSDIASIFCRVFCC